MRAVSMALSSIGLSCVPRIDLGVGAPYAHGFDRRITCTWCSWPACVLFMTEPASSPIASVSAPRSGPTWAAWLHYAAFAVLLIGGALYLWLKPPAINPITDPQAVKALALVHTHRAKHAPTLLQAVSDMVKLREQQGKKARMGEWVVEKQEEGHYVVKVMFREEGTRRWIEREYSWQVDLGKSRVHALSMPSIDLMRDEDLAPIDSQTPMPVS